MKVIQRNTETGYFQVKDKDGLLCWIPGEFEKLYEKYMTCKAKSESHRKARDYHKETVAKIRQELSEVKSMCKNASTEFEMISHELSQCEHHAEFWRTIAILTSCTTIAFMVLFFWAVRS